MSGNLVPGAGFAPTGSIASYSTMFVAPFVSSGRVKAATLKVIKDNLLVVGTAVMTVTIYRLIP